MIHEDYKKTNYFITLEKFRTTHNEKVNVFSGIEWKYISCGQGNECILLLTGGMGKGETFFLHIMELEKKYKVIVPAFPSVSTINELIEGIISIVDKENIQTFHVLGQSFGGLLVQELLHRYPERVDKAVLSHTTPNTPHIDESIMKNNRRMLKKLIFIVKLIPIFLLKPVFIKKVSKHFDAMNTNDRIFWQGYFSSIIKSKNKKDELSTYKCMLDFLENYQYTKESFNLWNGKLLILDSDADETFDKIQKQALKDLFPTAQYYEFNRTGHLSLIIDRENFMDKVKNFLK